jgi:hypothetical protein
MNLHSVVRHCGLDPQSIFKRYAFCWIPGQARDDAVSEDINLRRLFGAALAQMRLQGDFP